MDKVKDILIVNVTKSYIDENIRDKNGNVDEDKVKECVQEAWKLAYKRIKDKNIKYIVSIKNGEIIRVYSVSGSPNEVRKGRYKFELKELDNPMKDDIIEGIKRNNINLKYVVRKYLCSKDILN